MKKIYSLLLVVVSSLSFGQTFYSENMGTPAATTAISANVFQNSAPIVYSGTADVRSSLASSGYTGASAGGNVFINAVGEYFQIDGLNSSAYNTADIQLSFGINTPTAVTNVLVVEVSTNGGTSWAPITYTPSATGWTLTTIAGGVIPSSATLSIRFTSTSTLQYRIDDVKLNNVSASCTLALGTPTTACDANTAGTDTYTVTIPYTGAANGAYTITPNLGTVGGDNPSTTAAGNITISGVTEGAAFTASVTGVTCNFTVTANSPECDPINALPFVEPFNYSVGTTLGTSPYWTSIGTGDEILVAADNLNYTGLTSTGNHVAFGGGGIDAISPLTPTTSGTIYYSYLLNVDSMAGVTDVNGGYLSGFSDGSTTFAGTVWTKRIDDTTFNIGLEVRTANATNTTFSSDVLQTATTYLVVVGYTIGDSATASDDSTSLWINPIVGGAQPAASITDTHTGTDMTQITGFFLRQDSTTETPNLRVDELRVGTTWTDVTGTLSVSENAIAGLQVYPNPTNKGYFFVETALNAEKNVVVYDLLGKQVVNTTTSGSEINVANLNSGLYIVKITENGATATKKLVIE
jgi:Secretion system C-terminal sorting domain